MFFKISFLERPVLEGVFYNAGLCKIFYKTPQDDFFENIEMNFFFFFFWHHMVSNFKFLEEKKKEETTTSYSKVSCFYYIHGNICQESRSFSLLPVVAFQELNPRDET